MTESARRGGDGMRSLLFLVAIGLAGACGGPAAAPPGDVEDARAALRELTDYRGTGPRAIRETLRLVDRIVGGGGEMVEPLIEALGETEPFSYRVGAFSKDLRTGVISSYRNPRMAMLEALHRIGGEEAVAALIRASTAERDRENRIVALGFLGTLLDREDVQEHFGRRLERLLAERAVGPELVEFLRIARGRLDPEHFDVIAREFAKGWAKDTVDYEMGDTLARMDEERAAMLFTRILADPAAPGPARAAAARCLARLPAHRRRAAEILARPEGHRFVHYFLDGIRHGRIDEYLPKREAEESGDPERRREYVEEWLRVNRDAREILLGLTHSLPEDVRQATKIEEFVERMKTDLAVAERTLARLRKKAEGDGGDGPEND